jgi:hypothetical protein
MEYEKAAEQQGVVPSQRVRLLDEAAWVGAPGQPAATEPQVQLLREGSTVKAIDVVCTCGQHIRLRCVYPA